MRVEDYAQFEKDMQAFSFKSHQEFLSYYKLLLRKGWIIEDAIQWIEATKRKIAKTRRKARHGQIAYKRKMMNCPKCSTKMFIRPVNIDAKTQTGDPKDKSVWMCPNKRCLHVIYNERDIKEIMGIP